MFLSRALIYLRFVKVIYCFSNPMRGKGGRKFNDRHVAESSSGYYQVTVSTQIKLKYVQKFVVKCNYLILFGLEHCV